LAILTLCEIKFPLKFPASVILGVESTIFGLKIAGKKKTLAGVLDRRGHWIPSRCAQNS